MLKQPQKELDTFRKQVKLLIINELLEKDEDFDEAVRRAMGKALKKCPTVSKVIGLNEMENHEILDITTPIEKS